MILKIILHSRWLLWNIEIIRWMDRETDIESTNNKTDIDPTKNKTHKDMQ